MGHTSLPNPPALWYDFIWHRNQSCCETRTHGKAIDCGSLRTGYHLLHTLSLSIVWTRKSSVDVRATETNSSRSFHHYLWHSSPISPYQMTLFAILRQSFPHGLIRILFYLVPSAQAGRWSYVAPKHLSESKDQCRSCTSPKYTDKQRCWVEGVGHHVSSLVCKYLLL